jgi:hypothetical protein
VQNPLQPVPPRKKYPLHKVSSFLQWIQQVSQTAWKLGRDISGDEQTIGFRETMQTNEGSHTKAEGDGFHSVIHASMATRTTFISKTCLHLKSMLFTKAGPHFMHEFLVYLIL